MEYMLVWAFSLERGRALCPGAPVRPDLARGLDRGRKEGGVYLGVQGLLQAVKVLLFILIQSDGIIKLQNLSIHTAALICQSTKVSRRTFLNE